MAAERVDPAHNERQIAAVHMRARDLRKGDRVVDQGTVQRIVLDDNDQFIVTWERSLRHTHRCDGSWVVLVVVDDG